ncbi:MAG: hypothetical protein NXI20_28225 [bacterium]|nr:hypothetical protein [bacterium]
MNLVLLAHQKGTRLLNEKNCVGLTFNSNELSSVDFEKLRSTHNQYVTLIITDENIDHSQALNEAKKVILEPGEKWSKSQILRFAILDHASRKGITGKKEQEEFYRNRMDHFIAEANSLDI